MSRLSVSARGAVALLIGVSLAGCGHKGSARMIAEAPPAKVVVPDSEAIAAEARVVPGGPGVHASAVVSPPASAFPPTPVAVESASHAPLVGPQPRHMAPHTVADVDAPYLLDSGDRVRVFVYGQPSLSRIYTVDSGGFIALPLIGSVKARGESPYDLERAVTVQLGAKYVKDPKVSVEIATYRPFFILGEVRQAGQYSYVNGMTVQTAVAIAGGYAERASERRFTLTRRVNGVIEKMKVPRDTIVLPGDTIYVHERWF
jgi:polysaccharide export outer membrane protein